VEAFDIETYNEPGIPRNRYQLVNMCREGKRVLNVCAIAYSDKGEAKYCLGTDKESQKRFLLNMPAGTYMTWNGARFDNLAIIHLLHTFQIPYEYKYQRKSSLLWLEFTSNHGKVKFKDMCKIFPGSLEKITKELIPHNAKLAGTYDYSKPRPEAKDFTETDIAYVERDILALREVGMLLIKGISEIHKDLKINRIHTSGGLSTSFMKLMLREYYMTPDVMFPETELVDYSFITGGMVHVNPNIRYKTLKNVGHYDIVSFYPYTMSLDMPFGARVEAGFEDANEFLKRMRKCKRYLYFVKTSCKGKFEGTMSPILAKNSLDVNSMIFDWEEDTCVSIADPILRNKRLKLWDGVVEYEVYEKSKYLAPIMSELFKKKQECKLKGEMAKSYAYKIIANSLSGKFMQKPIGIDYVFHYNDDVEEVEVEPNDKPWHVYLPVGSILTAYARDMLCEIGNKLGDDFYYCDTDSVFFNMDSIDIIKENFTIGEELGNLSQKDFRQYDEAAFLGKKCYIARIGDKHKSVIAGLMDYKFENVTEGVKALSAGVPTMTLQGFATPQGLVLVDTPKGKRFKEVFNID